MKKIVLLTAAFLLASAVLLPSKAGKTVRAETESAVNVYSVPTGIAAPPSVVTEYEDGMDISALGQDVSSQLVRPSTMIVEADENLTVLCGGERIPYNDFRLKYIKSKMIPAVRVETEGAADALIAYLSQKEYDFIDFSVVSSSAALVKRVRDARPSIRGVIDYSESDLSGISGGRLANEANRNKAVTVILNYAQAAELTFGVQAMFKSVWVRQEVSDAPDLPTANLNGTTKPDFLVYMAQLNALNASANPSKSGFMTESWLFKNVAARGYLPFCWTFTSVSEAEGGVYRGVAGITTDRADGLGKFAKTVLTEKADVGSETVFSAEIPVRVLTYAGTEEERTATVLSLRQTDEREFLAILTYDDHGVKRVTPEIRLSLEERTESSPSSVASAEESGGRESAKKKGCSGAVGATPFFFVALFSAAVAGRRSRKNRP